MELGIAAEAGFEGGVEHGLTLAGAVDLKESTDALSISEVDHGEPGLLLEEPAEAGGAEAGAASELVEAERGGVFADEMRGAFHGGMDIAYRNIGGALEAVPGLKQSVAEPGVEQTGLVGGAGELGEELFEALEVLFGEAAAAFAGGFGLKEDAGCGIGGGPLDGLALEDGDPHFEVAGLLEQHVLLRGEEPEEIAATYLVPAVGEEVGS